MKKRIAMILILSLMLVGCTAPDSNQDPTSVSGLPQSTSSEGTLSQTDPTNHLEGTLPGLNSEESTSTTPTTPDSTENTTESGKPDGPSSTHPSTQPTDPNDSSTQATQAPTTPTQPEETTLTTTPTTPPPTTPTTPPTEPTDPVVPPTNPGTQPTTPPEETEPSEPVEDPTEPGTTPGETSPTEPPACNHDWKHIHHPEEGHWLAGIICDCGWTAYGDANDLLALWKAHYASYPAVEALFEHGGYGSMDEWVVDTPAYDEWVCSQCGEKKP